jgi:Protein of unknown function (DUF3253)
MSDGDEGTIELGGTTKPELPTGANRARARQAILELLEQRDPGKTICPSDAARALGGDGFQPLTDSAKGPIRLRAVHERKA